ncbi:MAG TPA: aldo/keto reductase [Hyphomicrobiaceae bacterium]|nr:aldo/keto reductase [Hyphomicrobiaceae bacterium]
MRMVTLPGGEKVPALGLGTWHMGERRSDRAAEAKALRAGLDVGLTLIDTAEMYGEGGAEEVVAEAVAGRRDQVFIVSKVYPHNASRAGAIAACERSLARLKTDRIDLYLLHWRGSYPLAETVAGFEALKASGKIRHWGVSNFDVDDMAELAGVAKPGAWAANQVLYHLGSRGIDFDLIPAMAKASVAIMAYSPLGQGAILRNPALAKIAARHTVSPAAVAVAWGLRHPHVISIPKASKLAHVAENAKAADLVLTAEDLAELDRAFPPPKKASPLGIL